MFGGNTTQSQQVSFQVPPHSRNGILLTALQIPANKTGLIIGASGVTVKRIWSQFNVKVVIPASPSLMRCLQLIIPTKQDIGNNPNTTITISGSDPAGAQAEILRICGNGKHLQPVLS